MPITVVQVAPIVSLASLTGPVTVTFGSPTTTGNTLVALVTTQGDSANPVVSAVTLGGAADHWQLVLNANPNVSYGGSVWYDPNCGGGQTAVAVTCASGAGGHPEIVVTVYEVSGVLAADRATSAVASSGATWSSGATATTSQAAEIFFGVVMNDAGSLAVTGAGTWMIQGPTVAGTFQQEAGYQIVSSTQAATFSGTQSTGPWVALVATFSAPAPPAPPQVSTADAVAREAAWLGITTDSLPALLAPAGPWQVVQAYWPGAKFAAGKTGIYIQRRKFQIERFGGVRLMPHYGFALKLVWPLKSTAAGIAETEQQNFDNAIELLRRRVNGLPFDKTHGGRFLSAAETPPGTFFEVAFDDPEVTIPQGKWLRAQATYLADDPEIIPA